MSFKKIFLVGLPGSGKTTLGQRLAQDLTIDFFDLDEEIRKDSGKTIPDLFESFGEEQFRVLEKGTLERVLSKDNSFVLATGGGTPCFFSNMERMNREGETVFIDTPIATIKKRIAKDQSRPLMKSNTLEELYQRRVEWYDQASKSITHYDELLALFKS